MYALNLPTVNRSPNPHFFTNSDSRGDISAIGRRGAGAGEREEGMSWNVVPPASDRFSYPLLTLPLHPHLTGVPHRIGFFCDILDMLLARGDTVFMVGRQIADWYLGECRRLGGA